MKFLYWQSSAIFFINFIINSYINFYKIRDISCKCGERSKNFSMADRSILCPITCAFEHRGNDANFRRKRTECSWIRKIKLVSHCAGNGLDAWKLVDSFVHARGSLRTTRRHVVFESRNFARRVFINFSKRTFPGNWNSFIKTYRLDWLKKRNAKNFFTETFSWIRGVLDELAFDQLCLKERLKHKF